MEKFNNDVWNTRRHKLLYFQAAQLSTGRTSCSSCHKYSPFVKYFFGEGEII